MLARGSDKLTGLVKNTIERTALYDVIRIVRHRQRLLTWKNAGRPIPPPPLFKQRVVREYAERFSLHIFVETGTFLGDMVYANRNTFDRLYSIELDRQLYERAKRRFSRFKHIHILLGDSAKILRTVLANVQQPCLLWLDAHAMVGGVVGKRITPVAQELHCILEQPAKDHVILIDDARLFVGQADYPTIEEVKSMILDKHLGWTFEVKDDIIRTHSPTCGVDRHNSP